MLEEGLPKERSIIHVHLPGRGGINAEQMKVTDVYYRTDVITNYLLYKEIISQGLVYDQKGDPNSPYLSYMNLLATGRQG